MRSGMGFQVVDGPNGFFMMFYIRGGGELFFRRSPPKRRSKSYLRSAPDLRSKLIPNPSESTRTIQPRRSAFAVVFRAVKTILISRPRGNLLRVFINAPPRLMLVIHPLHTCWPCLKTIAFRQGLRGNCLASLSFVTAVCGSQKGTCLIRAALILFSMASLKNLNLAP